MLYLGHNIRSQEVLNAITPEALFNHIKADALKLGPLTDRLRRLMAIDKNAYSAQKLKLPYFCIGTFDGDIRQGQRFLHAEYLVLDFDHLNHGELELAQEASTRHPQVLMSFRTPSNAGLKVLFHLHQPITDKKHYHDLGKTFGMQYARQFGLVKSLDVQTFDVTRASFICPDPFAYFNPDAVPVNWHEYLRESLLLSKYGDDGATGEEGPAKGEPNADAYKAILGKLKPNTPPRRQGPPIPEPVQEVLDVLPELCEAHELVLVETRGIQYGAQVVMGHSDGQRGECNLYFGKRGYTVVRSVKGNLHPMLTEILEKLIWEAVSKQQHLSYDFAIGAPQLLRKVQ
jgi:hypothetical protein